MTHSMPDLDVDDAVYIDRLESHKAALVGEEAQKYCQETEQESRCFYPQDDPIGNKERMLVQTIRDYHHKRFTQVSTELAISPVKLDLNKLSFSFLEGWGVKKQPKTLSAAYALQSEAVQRWQLDLSQFSFAQAALDKNAGLAYCELTYQGKQIPLFNAPYALSKACLTLNQRLSLFSHLQVQVVIRFEPKTRLFIVDWIGYDESGQNTTTIQFVGAYPGYEDHAFQHWYERIVADIAINEPFEVKHRYG